MEEETKIVGLLDPKDYPGCEKLVGDFNRKLLEISEENSRLTLTISKKEQKRQNTITGSVRVYNINVSRNLIEDEIFEHIGEEDLPVFEGLGLPNPCPLEDFIRRYTAKRVSPDDREAFRRHFNRKRLLKAYDAGEKEHTLYYRSLEGTGEPEIVRHTIVLTENPQTGDIIAMCNAKDGTEEERVLAYERTLKNIVLIHEALGSGQWVMDFDTHGEMIKCNWSDVFRKMLGYQNEEDFPNLLESLTDLLYEEDKARVLGAFWNAINDYSGRLHFDVECRVHTRYNGVRWFHACGRVSRREDGTPITIVGLFIDINDQKVNDARLREQLEIVEALSRDYLNIYRIDPVQDKLVILKQEGYRVGEMNRLRENYSYSDYVKRYVSDRVEEEDQRTLLKSLELSLVEDRLYRTEEYVSGYRIHSHDGIHNIQFKFIRMAGDRNFYILGLKNIDTIVDTIKERDNLKHLSETDLMTGLLNRGSGEKLAAEEIMKGHRGMFILCDIDKFKSINDTYGHGVGDKVICSIADCIRRSFREDDIVFRLGGDEFAALALHVDSIANAQMIIERLFDRIRAIHIPELGERKVTISVGAAMMDGVFATTFTELYKKADACVYESKKVPDNKVNFYKN